MGAILLTLVPLLIFFLLPMLLIMKFKKNSVFKNSQEDQFNRQNSDGNGGRVIEMVKDEVCGKFVLKDDSIECVSSGSKHYFCSESCRRKFVEINNCK